MLKNDLTEIVNYYKKIVDVEIKKEDRKIEKKLNKKILIYISLLIILGIAIFLII